jgi:ketosteroid isomerase-like protein
MWKSKKYSGAWAWFLVAAVAAPLVASASGAPNQYQVDGEAATAYAAAYSERDIPTLRALLADEAVFVDPSNHHVGRDKVIASLEQAFAKITGNGDETREVVVFRSGNSFVHVAFIDFDMLMAVGEQPEREFNFKVDFAMVLDVEDGKIIRHTDYVDTEAFVAQLQSQMQPPATQ